MSPWTPPPAPRRPHKAPWKPPPTDSPGPLFLHAPSLGSIALLLLLTLPFLHTLTRSSGLFTTYALVINVTTFIFYVHDKRRSRIAGWRVKETTLQILSMLGGWPTAYLSMVLLRHKTRKTGFLVLYWVTVVAWVVGWWMFR